MNWKKIIYLVVFLSIFLFKPSNVIALSCDLSNHIPSSAVIGIVCGDLNTAPKNCCTVGGGGEVPYCSSTCSSTKCSGKPAWTRWNITCSADCVASGPFGVWQQVLTAVQSSLYACSTADKWNSSDSTLIRAGLCNCSLGGIYKACCDKSTGNLVSSSKVLVGGAYDADCPAGTMIWNGGANITKQWAIDTCRALSCTPNCAATDGGVCAGTTYTGNCGQNCTGTKPLDYTNGACGAPNGQTYSTYNLLSSVTESSLCSSGTLVWTDGPGSIAGTDWNWNCVGTTGTCGTGVTANCSAIKNYSGVCGSANGQTYSANVLTDVVNGTQLCSSVLKFDDSTWLNPLWEGGPWTDGPGANAPDVSGGPNTWNWVCKGEGAGTNVACSAIKCTTVPPTFGNCGLVGQTFSTTPTTGLCTYGTPSVVTAGTNTYTWTCTGAAGTCPTTSGGATNCSAIRDLPPTIEEIKLYKNNGTTLVPPTTITGAGWNHTCETTFNDEKIVKWWVRASDSTPSVSDVASMRLRLTTGANCTGSIVYESAIVPASNGISIFTVDTSTIANSGTAYYVCAIAYDQHPPLNSGWMDTNRRFKVWDCNVPVSGRLYDGGASGSCSVAADYLTLATDTNFSTLDFTDSPTMNMSRSSENQYNGNLTWGKSYTADFNDDLAMQINGGGVRSNGANPCIGWSFTLNNSIVDPYSASPTLRVDFSGIVDQDSWYQSVGGGLMANSKISNRVPVTCTTNCAMSINGTINTNGIVASQLIDNTGGYPVDSVKKGNPNNWWINKNLAETNSEYSELLNQYFWKAGIGETFTGDKNLSEIGTTGVNFVNGNLTVTNDNNVNSGQFLMVVVNGNITVQSNVNNLEGIFVSRNLNIGGSSATTLTIEGMIKTTQNVRVNRTFIDKRTNNTTPAVKFVYRPDFIFSMPAAITKQLTKWQWGN